MPNNIMADLHVHTFSCTTFSFPTASVNDGAVETNAGISADKLERKTKETYAQGNVTAVSDTRCIAIISGATGTITKFSAGSIVANIGAATVTFDLKKNGTTVLSAVVTTDSGDSAYDLVDGTISSASVLVDDVLTIVLVATAGGGTLATGVFAFVELDEDPL